MIRYTRTLLLMLCLALGTATLCFAQDRMATVDLRSVFDNYWKTKKANAALRERGAEMEKELKALVSDFDKSKEEYQQLLESAEDQAVSVAERERRKKAATDKLKDLNDARQTIDQFQRQARTTIEEQQKRMRDNILEEVKAAVTSKAKAGGFTLVIDTAAMTPNNTPVFLYSSNPNDLTDGVLDQLNATAPLESEEATPAADK